MTDSKLKTLSKLELLKIIRKLEAELISLSEENEKVTAALEEHKAYLEMIRGIQFAPANPVIPVNKEINKQHVKKQPEYVISKAKRPAYELPAQRNEKLDYIDEMTERMELLIKTHSAIRDKIAPMLSLMT